MTMLARAQRASRGGRAQYARYQKPWLRAQDGSHPRDRWAGHTPKSENNCRCARATDVSVGFVASSRCTGAATRTHDDARLLPGCVAALKPLVCVLRSSLSLVCWCFGCLRFVSALAVAADALAAACSAGAAAGCASSGQRRLPQQSAATASATESGISSTASCGIRAHDLPLTERVLCQLS